jgi:hypothetical protein
MRRVFLLPLIVTLSMGVKLPETGPVPGESPRAETAKGDAVPVPAVSAPAVPVPEARPDAETSTAKPAPGASKEDSGQSGKAGPARQEAEESENADKLPSSLRRRSMRPHSPAARPSCASSAPSSTGRIPSAVKTAAASRLPTALARSSAVFHFHRHRNCGARPRSPWRAGWMVSWFRQPKPCPTRSPLPGSIMGQPMSAAAATTPPPARCRNTPSAMPSTS